MRISFRLNKNDTDLIKKLKNHNNLSEFIRQILREKLLIDEIQNNQQIIKWEFPIERKGKK